MITFRIRNRAVVSALTVTAALSLVACSTTAAPEQPGGTGRANIIATHAILGDVVSELVGDDANVEVFIPASVDPHSFRPSTREVAELYGADLIIENGLGFEEGMESFIEAARSDGVTVVSMTDGLELHAEDDHDHAHDHDHDHSHSHEHLVDPHFWQDPQLMLHAVEALREPLRALPGIDAEALDARIDEYVSKLHDLDTELQRMFAEIPEDRRVIVTQHRVLGYLIERYELRDGGAILAASSTSAHSSAAELAALSAAIEQQGIPAIFTDVTMNDSLAHTVAEESGGTVKLVPLYTESLGDAASGADTYLGMMLVNAGRIAGALT